MTDDANFTSRIKAVRDEWDRVKLTDDEEVAQRFLEKNVAFLPGAFGDIGPGGHHGPLYSSVFRQPPLIGLDAKLVPDFMWITRSTVEVTPICIEIERPTKRWFTGTGQSTADLTQALDQLARWKAWFREPKNEELFRDRYLKGRFAHRRITPQFVLIYGRETDFSGDHKLTQAARHAKRLDLARDSEHLFTYDSLNWSHARADLLTTTVRENGEFEVNWIPEDFTVLGDATGAYYLGSVDIALAANPRIDDIRAGEIRTAWAQEQKEGDRLAQGKTARPWK